MRLTTDTPHGNFETMLNYVFGKDGYAYIRSDGESEEPVALTEWARKHCIARGCEMSDMEPDGEDTIICDCAFGDAACPVFLAYTFACQAVHMRDRCKAYEDAIPFDDLPRAAELVKADREGRCVVLPCRDTVYIIVEDYFECSTCKHGDKAKYQPDIRRVSCDLDDCHCPRHIEEREVEGFNVAVDENGKLTVSDPGQWGCEGLETFVGVDGRWYLTRAEAEAALGGGGVE